MSVVCTVFLGDTGVVVLLTRIHNLSRVYASEGGLKKMRFDLVYLVSKP